MVQARASSSSMWATQSNSSVTHGVNRRTRKIQRAHRTHDLLINHFPSLSSGITGSTAKDQCGISSSFGRTDAMAASPANSTPLGLSMRRSRNEGLSGDHSEAWRSWRRHSRFEFLFGSFPSEPSRPAKPPDVAYSKTGHGSTSSQNDAKCQQPTPPGPRKHPDFRRRFRPHPQT